MTFELLPIAQLPALTPTQIEIYNELIAAGVPVIGGEMGLKDIYTETINADAENDATLAELTR